MKKNLIVLFSIVTMTAFVSCSDWAGEPITQVFSVDGAYSELDVEDAFSVYVSDTATMITITAGENVMPKVRVVNNDDGLRIYLKGWASNRGKDMTVIIPYNADLKKVDLSGASDFYSEFPLTGQNVEIELSGSSDFYGDIEAEEVDMDLSGSSSVKGNVTASELELDMSGASDAMLTGQVSTLKLGLSGASSLKRSIVGRHYAFVCDNCEGSMSGSSEAYIHCDGSITVSLSGASDLYYTGSAVTRGSSTSGSSNIVHDEL